MIVTHNQENKTRNVTETQSSFLLSLTATNIPSTVISVELNKNESVEWIWTMYPNGQEAVTGYNIIASS
ncbi:MAG: hypothetical protein ACFCAD_28745 [Pleurocapsa sp.]